MAVMARETWTDERIDDFKENVNERFDWVDKRFDQVDKRLDRIENSIEALRQTMNHAFFVLVGLQATSTLTLIGLKFF
jgi:tetrahydromethanopterin S-methyltransferase subunit G